MNASGRPWLRYAGHAAGGLALAIIVPLFTYAHGMHQIAGMDEGVMAKAAYALRLGYRPYVDFPTAVPPLFLYVLKVGNALSTDPSWSALVLANAIYAGLAGLALAALLGAFGGPLAAFEAYACAALATFLTQTVVGFPWYNALSALSLALVGASAAAVIRSPRSRGMIAALTASLVLAGLSKINLAVLSYAVVGGLAFLSPRVRRPALLALGLGALGTWLTLQGTGISAGLLFCTYARFLGRAASGTHWYATFFGATRWESVRSVGACLPLLIATAWTLRELWRRGRELDETTRAYAWLASGLIAAAFGGMITNNDLKFTEISVIGIAATLLLTRSPTFPFDWRRTAWLASFAALFAYAEMAGLLRLRSFTTYGFYDVVNEGLYQDGYFKGLEASERLARTGDQMFAMIKSLPPPLREGEVFLGPRLEMFYPAFHIHPPRGLPLWWEGFNDESGQDAVANELADRFVALPLKLIILWKEEAIFMPASVFRHLADTGLYTWSTEGELTFIKRK
jgi:hypothetical protein